MENYTKYRLNVGIVLENGEYEFDDIFNDYQEAFMKGLRLVRNYPYNPKYDYAFSITTMPQDKLLKYRSLVEIKKFFKKNKVYSFNEFIQYFDKTTETFDYFGYCCNTESSVNGSLMSISRSEFMQTESYKFKDGDIVKFIHSPWSNILSKKYQVKIIDPRPLSEFEDISEFNHGYHLYDIEDPCFELSGDEIDLSDNNLILAKDSLYNIESDNEKSNNKYTLNLLLESGSSWVRCNFSCTSFDIALHLGYKKIRFMYDELGKENISYKFNITNIESGEIYEFDFDSNFIDYQK